MAGYDWWLCNPSNRWGYHNIRCYESTKPRACARNIKSVFLDLRGQLLFNLLQTYRVLIWLINVLTEFLELDALHKAHLPSVLVACKCDNHPVNREVDPSKVNQKAKSVHADINTFQAQDSSSESQRRCLSVILRLIILAGRGRWLKSPIPLAYFHHSNTFGFFKIHVGFLVGCNPSNTLHFMSRTPKLDIRWRITNNTFISTITSHYNTSKSQFIGCTSCVASWNLDTETWTS